MTDEQQPENDDAVPPEGMRFDPVKGKYVPLEDKPERPAEPPTEEAEPADEEAQAEPEPDPELDEPDPEPEEPEPPRRAPMLSDYGIVTTPYRGSSGIPMSHGEAALAHAEAKTAEDGKRRPSEEVPHGDCEGELHHRGWPQEQGPTEWFGSRLHRDVYCTMCSTANGRPLFGAPVGEARDRQQDDARTHTYGNDDW